MSVYIVILLTVLFLLYIYSYYQLPKELVILQSSLAKFQFDMLREKQPIVIHDRLPNLDTIQSYWFKANKVKLLDLQDIECGQWSKNRYKYMVVYPDVDCELMVTLGNAPMLADGTPDPENAIPVVVQMKAHQLLILPYRCYWTMVTPCDKGLHALAVHDWITYFLP